MFKFILGALLIVLKISTANAGGIEGRFKSNYIPGFGTIEIWSLGEKSKFHYFHDMKLYSYDEFGNELQASPEARSEDFELVLFKQAIIGGTVFSVYQMKTALDSEPDGHIFRLKMGGDPKALKVLYVDKRGHTEFVIPLKSEARIDP
jgi:hypothetical protein